MRTKALGVLFGVAMSLGAAAYAQSGVRVEVDEITDNRVAAEMLQGSLQLRVKLTGNGLEKATAARVIVKEARDDRGTVLVKEKEDPPDFSGREYNSGMLNISVGPPARAAASVRIKGTVELYVPTRDPNAIVKVNKALAKLDKPLAHKTLKSAKIDITPLSPAGYAAKRKEQKIDADEIAKIRAEGKARGVSEKEIDFVVGLAQALDEDDGPATEGTIYLTGSKSHFDRVFLIELVDGSGQALDLPQRSSSSRGDVTLMTLVPRAPPPADAGLRLALLTDKSRMSFPFELNLELP